MSYDFLLTMFLHLIGHFVQRGHYCDQKN